MMAARCSRSMGQLFGKQYPLYLRRDLAPAPGVSGRQDIPIDNNHAPAAMRNMPARGAILRPKKVIFSKKMSNESRTIQNRFITPPTNQQDH